MGNMITINQQDYPNIKLGKSPCTWARYGCLSSVVLMGYNWLNNKEMLPPEGVKKLLYSSEGLLQWGSLCNLNLELKQSIRHNPGSVRGVVDKWWKDKNVFCALEIKNGVHFVWQIGRYWPGLGYRIFDPWTGKKTWQKNDITCCRIIGNN